MFKAESWRSEFVQQSWVACNRWEMEVLAALSGYAFEHPADAWPEIDDERPASTRSRWHIPSCPKARPSGTT